MGHGSQLLVSSTTSSGVVLPGDATTRLRPRARHGAQLALDVGAPAFDPARHSQSARDRPKRASPAKQGTRGGRRSD